MPIFSLGEWVPAIADDAFVAPSADVMGRVEIASGASVWYQTVLRGDVEPIVIGTMTNVQDGSVLHTEHDKPCVLGAGVTVGHKACIHGAEIGDTCLIGMGATILTGARVGAGSIVGAGSLVPEGKEVPPGVLVMGAPFKIKRKLTDEEKERLKEHARRYVEYAKSHMEWLNASKDGRRGPPTERKRP
jgi:carbonic anhydrase/acetyltransferase-like protein (isoleucine patch superfamily)